MSSQQHADRLAHALERTGLFEPVKLEFRADQVIITGRVKEGTGKKWNELLNHIEAAREAHVDTSSAWASHLCQRYFRKSFPNGDIKLVYAWNISIQAIDMNGTLDALIRAIKGEALPAALTPTQELTSMPLAGASANRNQAKNPGDKGVFMIGSEKEPGFRPPIRR